VLVACGAGVFVGTGVEVLVGSGVEVLAGTAVAVLAGTGVDVLVGTGVEVLAGTAVGADETVTPAAAPFQFRSAPQPGVNTPMSVAYEPAAAVEGTAHDEV